MNALKYKDTGRTVILNIVFIILFSCSNNHNIPPYKNPDLSIDVRTDDLLSRMTMEEKFWQCFMIPGDLSDGKEKYKHGVFGFQVATKGKTESEGEQLLDYSEGGTAKETAILVNNIQRYFVEETRLGIPIIAFDEALHGLVRKGATAFPQSIALAATWDTILMGNVANAIAQEVKSRGIRQILSPVLNIARDVRWGRTEETYGEDPFLTTQMGVAFISQFEKLGVITTPKHFVANLGDGGRDSYPVHFNERILEEIYFPAFKACFQKAGAWSVMTSYNSLDGRQCSANDWLLNQKLKKEWGFNGFVISDANAVGGANVLHYTSKNYAESGKQAIENGLDVIFQTSYDHKALFYPAFEKSEVDNEKLDEAVRRVLRAKFKLGLFENPYVDTIEVIKWNGSEKHRLIARKAAQKSIVLLKNEANTLPINMDIKSIAIIGTDAVEARLGGYSGPGIHPVSILDGIKNKIGKNCNIKYTPGCGREIVEFEAIPVKHLSCFFEGEKTKGLKGEYFNNISLAGKPALSRIDPQIKFRWTLYSPDNEKINYDWYSTRWTGQLTTPETGKFKIGIKGNDGYRLYINDELIIDNWQKQTFRTITKEYSFEKGKEYDLKIEFYESVGHVWFSLIWNIGLSKAYKQKIQEAVEL
ncbi:MAG: glycoside hydrolase family 3 N-terminal domain-containing protein, partial [Bacteroidota bacterium]|nr:glycoside hydrolase family 3 N-terminal domain-containing protein [Bacteroidota bacterium]